jgi:dihydrofolate reductase
MARLIYSSIASLDGYVVDASGSFDWAVPDDEVHAFLNDFERPIGSYLHGRRMYETMAAWEAVETTGDGPIPDSARIWQSADKIVNSRTRDTVTTPKTRIERELDPEAVRRLRHPPHATSASAVLS